MPLSGLVSILFTAGIFLLSSCSLEAGPKLEKSPIGEMAIAAEEGYGNKTAAARNQDGIDHLLREHWRKAEADFGRALEADPNLAAAHFNLALSLDQQEKRKEAADHFKKAAELAPDDPRIRGNEILKKYLTKE
ncbi:MAG TPA: tetratricopeptide repeat protein [Nitrospiria bacterium]